MDLAEEILRSWFKELPDDILSAVSGTAAGVLAQVAAEALLRRCGPLNGDQAIRHALDDLWACIGPTEIGHLQPQTQAIAKSNHMLLWHMPLVTSGAVPAGQGALVVPPPEPTSLPCPEPLP